MRENGGQATGTCGPEESRRPALTNDIQLLEVKPALGNRATWHQKLPVGLFLHLYFIILCRKVLVLNNSKKESEEKYVRHEEDGGIEAPSVFKKKTYLSVFCISLLEFITHPGTTDNWVGYSTTSPKTIMPHVQNFTNYKESVYGNHLVPYKSCCSWPWFFLFLT